MGVRPLGTTDLLIPAGTAPTTRTSKLINETGVGLEFDSKVVAFGGFGAGGRLTLETGVPISTTDQVDKTVLYYTPYIGNTIALYSATVGWIPTTFTELSLDIAALSPTTDSPLDVWIYRNAGVATMEVLAWTSRTARATALAYQDHVLIKSGDATRRYVGTVFWTSSSKMQDTAAFAGVWNYYNRVPRPLKVKDTTDAWTYSTDSVWQQANNSTANQVNLVIGVVEDSLSLTATAFTSQTNTVYASTGIGIDSSTVNSADYTQNQVVGSSQYGLPTARIQSYNLLGFRTYRWLEYVINGTGAVVTWHGDNGTASLYQSGLFGVCNR